MKRLAIALITILCMGSSLPVLKQDIRNSSGAGLSGALMYFYEAGTSTPYDTWSDEALTSANANPVVADGDGFFGEIYLDPDQTYKVVVKTSSGSTIYSVDNINAVQLTSSSLSARLKQVASNPIDWGAAGDGSTDDCAGDNDIQQAIDNATGVVDLLGLTYRCDSSISLASGITLKNGTIDFSNSSDAVLVDVSGTMGTGVDLSANVAAGAAVITVDSASGLSVGDWLLIYSSDIANSGEIVLIRAIAGTTLTLDRPLFGAYTTANNAQIKEITPAQNITVDNVTFTHSESAAGTPVVMRLDACSNVSILNSHFDTFSDAAINILTCSEVLVDNVLIENGDPYGITLCDGARDVLITNSKILDTALYGVTSCVVGSRREGYMTNVFITDSTIGGTSRSVYLPIRSYGYTILDNYLANGLYTDNDLTQNTSNRIIDNDVVGSGAFRIEGAEVVSGNNISGVVTITPNDNTSMRVLDNYISNTSGHSITFATSTDISGNIVAGNMTLTNAAGDTTIANNIIGCTTLSGNTATDISMTGNDFQCPSAPGTALTVSSASTNLFMANNVLVSASDGGTSLDVLRAHLSSDHILGDLIITGTPDVHLSNIYVGDDLTTDSDTTKLVITGGHVDGLLDAYIVDGAVTNVVVDETTDLTISSTYNVSLAGCSLGDDVTFTSAGGSGNISISSNIINGALDVTSLGYLAISGNVIDATDAAPNITLASYDAGSHYVSVTDNILIDGTYGVSAPFINNDVVYWGNQFISMATGDINGEVPIAVHYYGSASTPTGSSDQPGTGGDTNWHEMTGCANGDADLKGFTESDCDLVSTYGGTYLIGYSASFSGHNTESYVFGVSMGNPADVVPETGCYSTIYLDSANDFNVAGNCILAPAAGDTLRLITKSVGGGATEMSVDSLTFTATQL